MGTMKYKSLKEKRFEEVYDAYADNIYKVCLHYLRDEARAKEVVVETFFEVYKNLEYIEPEKMFSSLICVAKYIIDNKYGTQSEKEVK